MNKRRVEPLNVPGAWVSVQDLVGDGGRRQEERGTYADSQREGAHAKTDLEELPKIQYLDCADSSIKRLPRDS